MEEPASQGLGWSRRRQGTPLGVLLDDAGDTLWSSKVYNDETAILEAIGAISTRADQVTWAVDVTGTMSGLLLAMLAAHNQSVKYVPGRIVNRMSETYRGEAKTGAPDAYVIAESARQRGDLTEVEVSATLVAVLRLLVTHRTDLVADRVRVVNRLRDVLSGYFPALERAFDYAHSRGALVLLTGYQIPAAIRRIGQSWLQAWLVKRKVRSAAQIAADAVGGATAQHSSVPGQDVASTIVADLATQLLAIDERLKDLDARGTETFRAHPQAEIIESLPGMGPILGAELIAAEGDLNGYANAGCLASAAGLVPVPRDSGRRTGNMHCPTRYSQAAARVLPICQRSDDARSTEPGLLPEETQRGRQARPGTHLRGLLQVRLTSLTRDGVPREGCRYAEEVPRGVQAGRRAGRPSR